MQKLLLYVLINQILPESIFSITSIFLLSYISKKNDFKDLQFALDTYYIKN